MECVASCPVKNTLTVGVIPVKKTLKRGIIAFASVIFLFVVYKGMNADSLFNVSASNNSTSSSTVITGEIAAGYGDASGIVDGVYEGTGIGFRGNMTVNVTVKNQQITAIEVTETNDELSGSVELTVQWFPILLKIKLYMKLKRLERVVETTNRRNNQVH